MLLFRALMQEMYMKRVKKSGKWIHRGSRFLPMSNGPRKYTHDKKVTKPFSKIPRPVHTSCRQSLCRMKAPKTMPLALGDAAHNEDSGKDRMGSRAAWTCCLWKVSSSVLTSVSSPSSTYLSRFLSLFLSHLPLNLKWMNSLNYWHDPQFNPIANLTSES